MTNDELLQWVELFLTGAPEQQERAMNELAEPIRRTAQVVASRYRESQFREDLTSEAPTVIWEKLHRGAFDLAQAREHDHKFLGWCQTVLERKALDRLRKRKRGLLQFWEHLPEKEATTAASPASAPRSSREVLARRFQAIRASWTELGGLPSKGTIDYFAVLLLATRARVAAQIELTAAVAGGAWSAAERLLPWDAAEESRRIRPGLAPLAAVWLSLHRLGPPTRGELNIQVVRALTLTAWGEEADVSAWYKWVDRAKRRARERLGAELWRECYAGLFPDHES